MPRPMSSDHVCYTREKMACHAQRRPTPYVLSMGDNGIPRSTSSDHVCWPRAMMAFEHRRNPTVCVVHGRFGMSRHTSSYRVCCPMAMLACHARHHPIVCNAQVLCGHATPDNIQSCVLSKGDDNMPHPTSSDCLSFLRAMNSCHARRRPTTCEAQGR